VNWAMMLAEGLMIGGFVVCFVCLYLCLAERQDRRRARYTQRKEREGLEREP
jgi:hypothetical protein